MDRCPTCGAAVRPGAKFCTSCGSRLDEKPVESPESGQETVVATAPAESYPHDDVTPEPDWKTASGGVVEDETDDATPAEPPLPETPDLAEADSTPAPEDAWSAKWPEPRDTDSVEDTDSGTPAERFRSGLDDSGNPQGETANTWSWSASEETAASTWNTDADEVPAESETITPVAPETDTDESDDESAASTTENAPGRDPRQHASELLDEVRGLIWQIGTADRPAGNEKNVIQNISRVRGETSDFADLEPVIAAVRDNPRDIDALRDLGEKASRLNDLLESHKRLVSTLEDALSDQ